jgi:hypothetical protein
MPTFELSTGTSELHGDISASLAPHGPYIGADESWSVDCAWSLTGPLAPALDGEWRLTLLLESIPPDVVLSGETATIPLAAAPPESEPREYSHTFTFEPGRIELWGEPTVFLRLSVALTHHAAGGEPGPIAGFGEIGTVVIYEDGTGPPGSGTLAAGMAAAQALAHVDRLLILDDLWTTYLATTAPPEADLPAVVRLGEAMDVALDALPRLLRPVVFELGGVDSGRFDTHIHELTARDERLASALGSIAPGGGSVHAALLDACRVVVDAVPEELALLRSKVQAARTGLLPDPDLSPGMRCGLTLVGAAAAATGTIASGGAAMVVATGLLGQMAALLLAWEGSGCSSKWQTFRARLRASA